MTHFIRLMGIGLVLWSCVVTLAVSSAAQAAANHAATGTVLVTGSSRGIGLEFARQYAAAGWTVIATARKPMESANLRELARRHPNVRLEALDVVDGVSVSALRDRLRGVAIDVLINNAGDTDQFRGQSLGSLDHDRFDYLMRINAQGPLRVTEALLPNLEAGTQKKIVAISSLAGSLGARGGGMPGGYWYKASKAALNMMVVALALELQPKGFKVVALSPGQVDTQGYAARGIVMPGTVPIEQSVAGLRSVITGLTPEQSGTFIRYSGDVQPW